MYMLTGFALAAVLAATGTAAPAKQDAGPPAPPVLAPADRAVPGGRLVLTNVPQPWIETSIFLDPIARNYSGNIWGDLIWLRSINSERTTVATQRLRAAADLTAAPVRTALGDFDTDALALKTTKAALATLDWFQARDFAISRDPYAISRIDFLAQDAAAQVAFVKYRYDLSPDFTQIRVLADIIIERQPIGKDDKPLSPPVAIYRQSIMSIAQLRTRSYEDRDNARRWAADNGKLARAGLTAAFAQFERLIPYALGLGQADVTRLAGKKTPKAFAGGYNGSLIARDANEPDDVLIWSKGLIHVQPIG